MQKGYYPNIGGGRQMDSLHYPYKNGPAQTYFTFLVRERDGQKDIVYIHYVTYIPYKHGIDFIV